jgi:c(7)-type cytochrome triheme protein
MKRLFIFSMVIVCLTVPMSVLAQKVGGGDLTFTPKNALPVVFSHDKHVDNKALKCTACHYQIFQMAQGSYKMNMNKLTEGGFCGKCHNGQKAFSVKDQKNCSRCHR